MTIYLLLILGLYSLFTLLEMLFPAEPHQGFVGRGRNIAFGFIFLIVGFFLTSVCMQVLKLQPRLLPAQGVFVSVIIFICYFLLIDFIFYWYHRAQHSFPAFWAIHILHHSDSELNVTSTMRTFWLEKPLQFLIISFPVEYVIGCELRNPNLPSFSHNTKNNPGF